MTRETRIGLLVGLVFIVMFGLVLTELTGTSSSTSPVSPADQKATGLVWSPQVEDVSPAVVQPDTVQVASASKTAPVPPPVPLAAQYAPITSVEEPAPTATRIPPLDDSVVASQVEEVSGLVEPSAIARHVEPGPGSHTVVKGDTLYSLASRYYDPSNANLHRLIAQANKEVLGPKGVLQIGQVLAIPPLPQSARPRAPGVQEVTIDQLPQRIDALARGTPPAPTPTQVQAGAPKAQAGGARAYTVKRGDNLTKIAAAVMGDNSRSAVKKLYDANRTQLKNPNLLVEGMTLSIPQ